VKPLDLDVADGAPTQRQEPQGGLASPMADANTIVTIESYHRDPQLLGKGKKIGVNIRMIGIASRNVPMARYVKSSPE